MKDFEKRRTAELISRRKFLECMFFAFIEIASAPAAPPSGRVGLVIAGIGTIFFTGTGIPRAKEMGIVLGTGALFRRF